MIQETRYGKTIDHEGYKIDKLRGGRSTQVIKNKKKYTRKIKHKRKVGE